jgi:predicted enzyme related to lactoylglutathione lyase
VSSTVHNITFDCADPLAVARFWAEVTGWRVSQPYQPGEYAVASGAASRPSLYFVQVTEGKSGKNRVHLDVSPADRAQDEEIARLTALGASVVSDRRPEFGWVVLADPEGNEFCLEPGRPGPAEG